MTFILSEDRSLRDKLLGMVVTDQKAAANGTTGKRSVGVWFGQPDLEIKNQSYPYVTLDLIDLTEDRQREMRGTAKPAYLAPATVPEGMDWEIDMPIPVNLDYQVTSYARQPHHDREILGQLMGTKLPIRYGTLECDDGTVRRLDVLGVSKRDSTENGKRLFVNAFTVRVSSEIPVHAYYELYKVLSVNVESPSPVKAEAGYSGESFTTSAP
jgi:hypothetical protein